MCIFALFFNTMNSALHQAKEETVIFELSWIDPVSEQLEAALDDRDLTAEQLASLTGIPLADLRAFLSGTLTDLSPAQYHLIETKLNLPSDYFARCKAVNQERAERLGS